MKAQFSAASPTGRGEVLEEHAEDDLSLEQEQEQEGEKAK